MTTNFKCQVHTIEFNENYQPEQSTRLTTNFANLARGEKPQTEPAKCDCDDQ